MVVTRLTEHDVIKPLLRGAARLGRALGPAPSRTDSAEHNTLRDNALHAHNQH